VLLGVSCASTPDGTDELPFQGMWVFNGAVQGAHDMRDGLERFTEPVNGTVEFLPDVVIVNGTHGSCTIPRERAGLRLGRLSVGCGSMSLRVGPTRGEVTIPVQRMREVRAGCAAYRNDDPRAGCIEWNYRLTTQTVRLTGTVSVSESGTP
jgi:hypothetical protein